MFNIVCSIILFVLVGIVAFMAGIFVGEDAGRKTATKEFMNLVKEFSESKDE